MEIRKVSDLESKFWWVTLSFFSCGLCSLKHINFQSSRWSLNGLLSTLLLWLLIHSSNLCSAFLLSLFSSLVSCCCGLRVRVFVWTGHPLPHPPSPLPSSLYILSLPVPSITSTWALPCLGASLCSQREEEGWKPHTFTHRHTQTHYRSEGPSINTWSPPNTVVWKALGRWVLCLCKTTT